VAHIPTVKDLQRKTDDHSLGKETHAWAQFRFLNLCIYVFNFAYSNFVTGYFIQWIIC